MSKRKKCYAVSVGHTPGIYDTWYRGRARGSFSSLEVASCTNEAATPPPQSRREECKAQVDGFSGAKYKGFATQAQAQQFLEYANAFGFAPAGALPHSGTCWWCSRSSGASAAPRPRVGAATKRKREDTAEDGSGEGEGEGDEQRTGPARQTKLISSPFFSTSSSSVADPPGRKRPRTLPSRASSSTRYTTRATQKQLLRSSLKS
jgi:hypothetical protein